MAMTHASGRQWRGEASPVPETEGGYRRFMVYPDKTDAQKEAAKARGKGKDGQGRGHVLVAGGGARRWPKPGGGVV